MSDDDSKDGVDRDAEDWVADDDSKDGVDRDAED